MTDREWQVIVALIRDWWPRPFPAEQADSWRLALDGHDPQRVIQALATALADGGEYRSLPRVVAALRHDPSVPTADEALHAIYGPRGVLRARPPYPPGGWTGDELRRASDALALERADEIHPLLGAFVRRQGLGRLRALPVDDPDWGHQRRRELLVAWERHVDVMQDRDLAALTAPRGEGPRRLDPLASLGLTPPALPAAEEDAP